MTELLKLENLHYSVTSNDKNLSQLEILKGINLEVKPQEKLAIIGRSGSGKSTLLALMAGLTTPSSGEITLLGQQTTQLNDDARAQLRAKQIGFMFQNFELIPAMTALENVLLPLELFGEKSAKEKALEALKKVNLQDRINSQAATLSGGEQQRVALARALITQPKIIFADEPTGNLDEETAEQIQDLLLNLDTTLILVTHDLDFAKKCDRQLNLLQGKLHEA